MKRQFQIRITSEERGYEDCLCFDSLAESNAAYQKFLSDTDRENEYHIEQVEVLQQHLLTPGEALPLTVENEKDTHVNNPEN